MRLRKKKTREVYDPGNKQLDYREMRATDVKSIKRVYIPKPTSEETEEQLQTRGTLIKRIVKDFIVDEKVESNLTQSEKNGVRKLRERIKRKEIVIVETDKSGKLGYVH